MTRKERDALIATLKSLRFTSSGPAYDAGILDCIEEVKVFARQNQTSDVPKAPASNPTGL